MHLIFSKEGFIIKNLKNEQIKFPEVRLIDENGEQLGVMPTEKAKEIAQEKELDLVAISPNAKPAVCKVMDYGKFKFEQEKKAKESRKKQKMKRSKLKEIKISLNIDQHDMDFKKKRIKEFLDDGDKVRVSLRLVGREKAFRDEAIEKLKSFIEMVDYGKLTKSPQFEGWVAAAQLDPDKTKK